MAGRVLARHCPILSSKGSESLKTAPRPADLNPGGPSAAPALSPVSFLQMWLAHEPMGHRFMTTDARIAHDRELLLRRLAEMEAEIGHLGEELSHANRLATMGILAGMIVHEFNNVLTPVLSYAHLALHAPEDRELVTKALTRIIGGTEQVARVASAILGFIRSDDQMGTTDVNHVLDEAIACLGRKPERHRIRIVREVPPGLRLAISPVCLQQVLLNLFINAIQAMTPAGGGEIRILTDIQGPGTRNIGAPQVVLVVADNGPGMPPEFARRAFDLFTSLKRPESSVLPSIATPTGHCDADLSPGDRTSSNSPAPQESHGGHGLGLAICRRLIEESGGEIWLETEVGRGTRFHIALSAAEPDGPPDRPAAGRDCHN